MDTNIIIASLNDFNKIADSVYKDGMFVLTKQDVEFQEVISYRKYIWRLHYKSIINDKEETIKEFTHIVPLSKLNAEEIKKAMTKQLLLFIYGLVLRNYGK